MTPGRWQAIEELFDAAVDLSEDEQDTLLRSRCGGDAELEAEVRSLLGAASGMTGRIRSAIGTGADLARGPAAEGRRLGAWRITKELGRGGMGAVYLAVRDDDQYRTEVAIKLLQVGLESQQAVARFRDERQILATLQHPGIVRLLDGGSTEEGLPYLVMEYVDGVPLTRWVAEREPTIRARVELIRAVCAAVQYAHQKLVVHRDLKPQNILVTGDGEPKLLDFGIATLLAEEGARAARTRTGMQILTPEYASPEQVRGEPVSTATDVYSLGLVLYEVLTGCSAQRPKGEGTVELMRGILERVPPRPSTVAPAPLRRALAGDLDNIVLKALEKEPARRYPSVEALSEDLLRHLDGRPVLARPPTWSYRTGKFAWRNRVPLAAATLVLAALGTATVVSVGQARRADEQARIAQRRFEDVRQLANTLLFDVDEQIRDLAGATAARELIVSRALVYLDALAADPASDDGLSRELAVAYIKIGDIQGNPVEPNLGRAQDALASYARAEEILVALPPDDPDTRWELVRERTGRSQVRLGEDDIEASRTEALRATGILDEIPLGPGYRFKVAVLARMQVAQIDLYLGEGTTGSADRLFDVASEWQRSEPTSESAYFLGVAEELRGRARALSGDTVAALDDVASATQTFRRLIALVPESAAYRRELAAVLYDEARYRCGGEWWLETGDCAAAEAAVRESLDLIVRMTEQDPEDGRAWLERFIRTRDVGMVLKTRADASALSTFEASREVQAGLPTDLREAHVTQGEALSRECAMVEPLVRAGRAAEARSLAADTLKVLEDPASVSAYAGTRPRCLYEVARGLHALGDDAAAARALSAAQADLRATIALHPTSVIGYVGLAESNDLVGVVAPAERCTPLSETAATWRAWPGPRTDVVVARLAAIEAKASGCF